MNAFEIVTLIVVILLLGAFATWKVISRRRKKESGVKGGGCGCGCSGCAASGSCPGAAVGRKDRDEDDTMPEIPVQSSVTCSFDDIVEQMNKKN